MTTIRVRTCALIIFAFLLTCLPVIRSFGRQEGSVAYPCAAFALDGRSATGDFVARALHVTVTNQLTGLPPRYGKAETIDHVVETALQLLQQHFAGDATGTGSAFKVVAELLFLGKVDALRLCFSRSCNP